MNMADFDTYTYPVLCRIKAEFDSWAHAARWLDEQLGTAIYYEYCQRHASQDFPLPDIWRELFTAMNSPHWRTVLRIWQLKHGVTPCQK